jgi:hypothetical protein
MTGTMGGELNRRCQYLEKRWTDIHTRLVAYASDQLNERLPPDLAASTEERIAIESNSDVSARLTPDVSVVETGFRELVEFPGASRSAREEGISVIAAPYKLVVDLDPITERFIKIIGPDDQQTITVIEFISPTNKTGIGLEKLIRKREELLEAGVSVVEIDLVRRGDWRALLKPHVCPREAISEYRVTVRPGGDWRLAYLYPLPLRMELSSIPIPLRKGDPQVLLDLQHLVNEAYGRGRYADRLDYSSPPDIPLNPDDARWAAELVAAQRK